MDGFASPLGPALEAAGAALADGDAGAIRPLLKVLDQLDCYREIARAWRAGREDDPARLVDRIEPMAAPRDAAGAGLADAAMPAGPLGAAHAAESDARNISGFIQCNRLKMND